MRTIHSWAHHRNCAHSRFLSLNVHQLELRGCTSWDPWPRCARLPSYQQSVLIRISLYSHKTSPVQTAYLHNPVLSPTPQRTPFYPLVRLSWPLRQFQRGRSTTTTKRCDTTLNRLLSRLCLPISSLISDHQARTTKTRSSRLARRSSSQILPRTCVPHLTARLEPARPLNLPADLTDGPIPRTSSVLPYSPCRKPARVSPALIQRLLLPRSVPWFSAPSRPTRLSRP